MALVVVGGGRRSGKSRYAQALASAHGPKLAFIGTMRPEDDEENPGKIAAAREERGSRFVTYEEPLEIVKVIEERAEFFDAIVIDDLTVWVSNLVMSGSRDPKPKRPVSRPGAPLRRGSGGGHQRCRLRFFRRFRGVPPDAPHRRTHQSPSGRSRLTSLLDGLWHPQENPLTRRPMATA